MSLPLLTIPLSRGIFIATEYHRFMASSTVLPKYKRASVSTFHVWDRVPFFISIEGR